MEAAEHRAPFASRTVSLIDIPREVLEFHVLKFIGISSLISCSLVCSLLRRISSRLSKMKTVKGNQDKIMEDIFGNGYLNLLGWFQSTLQFPSAAKLTDELFLRSILLAVEGFLEYIPSFCRHI